MPSKIHMYGWLGTRTCMSNVKTSLYTYKAQYTSKREDTVFKTKYYSSYLYTNFVYEMGHMKFSVYFGTHMYSKGHEYTPWQYERMSNKSMVNRLIRTKLSAEAQCCCRN